MIAVVERELLDRRLVRPGECVILLMGFPIRQKALTNLLRIHRVAARAPVPPKGRAKGPVRAGDRKR